MLLATAPVEWTDQLPHYRGMKQALAVLFVVAAGGCTAPEPDAHPPVESATAKLGGPSEPASPGGGPEDRVSTPAPVPEPAPEPEPAPVPEPAPEPATPAGKSPRVFVKPADPEFFEDGDRCPITIVYQGFPAISTDGSVIVFDDFEVDDASTDPMDGVHSVQWLGALPREANRSETIAEGSTYHRAARKDPATDPCKAYTRQAKRGAQRVNKLLARHQWRQLRMLDIVLTDPYRNDDAYEPPRLREIEAAVRPVEMFWRNDRLIARTPGVKVHLDIAAPWANEGSNYEPGEDAEFDVTEYSPCDEEPVLSDAYGDATTGALLVSYDYDRPHTSCLCEQYTYRAIVHAPPELFERLDQLERTQTQAKAPD